MKGYFLVFGTIAILIVLVLTNPDEARHSATVKEILTKEFNRKMTDEIYSKNSKTSGLYTLGLIFGETLIDKTADGYIGREDFYLFSLTKIDTEDEKYTIGFGILGNVYVSDKLKENFTKRLDEMAKENR